MHTSTPMLGLLQVSSIEQGMCLLCRAAAIPCFCGLFLEPQSFFSLDLPACLHTAAQRCAQTGACCIERKKIV